MCARAVIITLIKELKKKSYEGSVCIMAVSLTKMVKCLRYMPSFAVFTSFRATFENPALTEINWVPEKCTTVSEKGVHLMHYTIKH